MAEDRTVTETDLAGFASKSALEERQTSPRNCGELPVGALLGRRYLIVKLLGKGGMGAVYLARDAVLEKNVALKLVERADDVGRLRDEVQLAQEVTHRNVCRTYDLEEVDRHWLVKMEYVRGETLADRVGRAPLSVDDAISVAREIVDGLVAAHARRVVHRDLKPQNVMIEEGTGRVLLMDFGIARLSIDADRTAEGITGTPQFMAPEQARGRKVDERADLYSLGCVLYYMLTGEVLFYAESPVAVALRHIEDAPPDLAAKRPDIPAWLVRVIRRLLEKDAERRFPNAIAVGLALTRPVRPRRARMAVIALLASVTAVVGALVYLRISRAAPVWSPVIKDLPSYEENADGPAFSPDGTQIAYGSDRERPYFFRIYVESIHDGQARAVTPPDTIVWDPRWTRDGTALLVAKFSPPTIYKVALSGGEPTVIDRGSRAADDCNGKLLFLHTTPPPARLVLRDLDGSERELRQFRGGDAPFTVRCDRDGKSAVYTLGTMSPGDITFHPKADLAILSFDGSGERQLTHDRLENASPTFHPDGRSIIFSSMRSGKPNLWEIPIDGGPATRLTFGDGPDYGPDVSPDGKRLIFSVDTTRFHLFAFPLDGQPRRLTSKQEDVSFVEAFPDGRELVGIAQRQGRSFVVAIPAEGGDVRTLAEGGTASIDPSGQFVLFTDAQDRRRMLIVPRTGGAARVVTELRGMIFRIRSGGDGYAHLMLQGDAGPEAWRVAIADGSAEREAPAPWAMILRAPTGPWRMALRVNGDLYDDSACLLAPGMALDDSTADIIHGMDMTWDYDGRSVVYKTDGKLRRRFVHTREDVIIKELLPTEVLGFAVAPDGKTFYNVMYVSHVRRQMITNYGDRPRPR